MSTASAAGRIERFSFAERVAHWMSAASFLYAALSGLSLWTPALYWLTAVFGGGDAARRWHPWAGVVFALVLGKMFVSWAKEMKLDASDRRWLRSAHRYAVHDHDGLPEPGKFNAGQKLLFWTQTVSAAVLFGSGLVLWFPEAAAATTNLRLVAVLLHPLAAIVSLAGIIVHVYMGTAAVPGAFRGMVHGWVDRDWAESHHPKWAREPGKR